MRNQIVRLTNRDAVRFITQHTNLPRLEISMVLDCFVEWITNELIAGRTVAINHLGTFDLRLRKGRTNTKGNHWLIGQVQPDIMRIKFDACSGLRKAINGKETE
jgi:nucleoid DNA-binding protein